MRGTGTSPFANSRDRLNVITTAMSTTSRFLPQNGIVRPRTQTALPTRMRSGALNESAQIRIATPKTRRTGDDFIRVFPCRGPRTVTCSCMSECGCGSAARVRCLGLRRSLHGRANDGDDEGLHLRLPCEPDGVNRQVRRRRVTRGVRSVPHAVRETAKGGTSASPRATGKVAIPPSNPFLSIRETDATRRFRPAGSYKATHARDFRAGELKHATGKPMMTSL